jgi:hypothetical protein
MFCIDAGPLWNIFSVIDIASGPERRMIAIAPLPDGVDIAAIVSILFILTRNP